MLQNSNVSEFTTSASSLPDITKTRNFYDIDVRILLRRHVFTPHPSPRCSCVVAGKIRIQCHQKIAHPIVTLITRRATHCVKSIQSYQELEFRNITDTYRYYYFSRKLFFLESRQHMLHQNT